MSGIVVMGVSGAGKSTVGRALADALGRPFLEGDELHSAASVAKMRRGEALTDVDRRPWLATIGAWLAREGGVAACSALRRAHRDALRAEAPGVFFVHLTGDAATIRDRVASRPAHFMPATLVPSQLETLEPLGPGERGATFGLHATVEEIVRTLHRDRAC